VKLAVCTAKHVLLVNTVMFIQQQVAYFAQLGDSLPLMDLFNVRTVPRVELIPELDGLDVTTVQRVLFSVMVAKLHASHFLLALSFLYQDRLAVRLVQRVNLVMILR